MILTHFPNLKVYLERNGRLIVLSKTEIGNKKQM